MSENRIVSATRESEVRWPDRDGHRAIFENMLGDAYSAAMRLGVPMAFVYIGATCERATKGQITQMVTSDPAEGLEAILNCAKTGVSAGKFDREDILKLIANLRLLVKE